jgi:hypothetical protein
LGEDEIKTEQVLWSEPDTGVNSGSTDYLLSEVTRSPFLENGKMQNLFSRALGRINR